VFAPKFLGLHRTCARMKLHAFIPVLHTPNSCASIDKKCSRCQVLTIFVNVLKFSPTSAHQSDFDMHTRNQEGTPK
jgi:hypothetical protein